MPNLDAHHPEAAMALDARISATAERLRAHPALGRAGRVPGTRELLVPRRYFLLYEIEADTVRILAVLHTARRWPPAPG